MDSLNEIKELLKNVDDTTRTKALRGVGEEFARGTNYEVPGLVEAIYSAVLKNKIKNRIVNIIESDKKFMSLIDNEAELAESISEDFVYGKAINVRSEAINEALEKLLTEKL